MPLFGIASTLVPFLGERLFQKGEFIVIGEIFHGRLLGGGRFGGTPGSRTATSTTGSRRPDDDGTLLAVGAQVVLLLVRFGG